MSRQHRGRGGDQDHGQESGQAAGAAGGAAIAQGHMAVQLLEGLEAVRACRLLDTEPEPAFDDITACAAELLELPIVLVSLVDRTRQWFKSARGLAVTEAPRDAAFCGHVVDGGLPIVVRDTLKDQRFRDHPMVVGPPHVRFYAGVPLRNPDALVLGALGVFDVVPRILEPAKVDVLVQLASQISDRIELRRGAFLFSEERRRVHELTQHAETLLEVRPRKERRLAGASR